MPSDGARADETARVADYATNWAAWRLAHSLGAGDWVRTAIDDENEAGVACDMWLQIRVWRRLEPPEWWQHCDDDDAIERALRLLLVRQLWLPIEDVRQRCWPLIASGMHRSDPAAVERAARAAGPSLPERVIARELAAIVRQQRTWATAAARGRR